MLLNELVPLAQRETGVQRVATAGCSFGGYHATNFAFKHPEVVKYVFNMGAAFDIHDQMDGYYDENVYFNNPPDLFRVLKILSSTICLLCLALAHKICVGMPTRRWQLSSRQGNQSLVGCAAKMLHTIGLPGEKCFRTIFRSSNNFK